jgi:hypothetical protein
MGIEIVKDYQFEDDQTVEKKLIEDNNILNIQTGRYDLGLTYELNWSLHLTDNLVEIRFVRRYDGTMEIKTLNKENSFVTFVDYWRPYNRVDIQVQAIFDDKQVLLNGNSCVRRETYSKWICSNYKDVMLINW